MFTAKFRETTSAFWQKKIFYEPVAGYFNLFKRHYFFAVQCIGENRNESLAMIPKVSR